MVIKLNPQVVGNVGLYYVCYKLSLQGWNVMPTARNARGIDCDTPRTPPGSLRCK